jgi:hypothetical protein
MKKISFKNLGQNKAWIKIKFFILAKNFRKKILINILNLAFGEFFDHSKKIQI